MLAMVVALFVAEPGVTAQSLSEGDIAWSATGMLLSQEAGKNTAPPDPNPLVGTWAVSEIRLDGQVIDAPAPSRGRSAGLTIWGTGWTQFYGFDGCNELDGKLNLFSGTLVVEGNTWTAPPEVCPSLRFQAVLRRALASSPRPEVGADQWSINVRNMFVRFTRANESTLDLGTMPLAQKLSSTAWRLTGGQVDGNALVPQRPSIWQFGIGSPSVFDGCRSVTASRVGRLNWVGPSIVRWSPSDQQIPSIRPGHPLGKSNCPTSVVRTAETLSSVVNGEFTVEQKGSSATITSGSTELRLEAMPRTGLSGAFQTPPERPGVWTSTSLSVSGAVAPAPQNLVVRGPNQGGYVTDGCNNFSSSSIEADGTLYGSIVPITFLPCPGGERFVKAFASLMSEATVRRNGDTVTLANADSSITFVIAPIPQVQPTQLGGPELSGSWTVAHLQVADRKLSLPIRSKNAGLVTITFAANRRASYSDGCNGTRNAQYGVVGGRLALAGGVTTAMGCFGAEADDSATALASAVRGQVAVTPSALTFTQGSIVAVFRRDGSSSATTQPKRRSTRK